MEAVLEAKKPYEQQGPKTRCDLCAMAYLGSGRYCPRIGTTCNSFMVDNFESLSSGQVYMVGNGQKTKTRSNK